MRPFSEAAFLQESVYPINGCYFGHVTKTKTTHDTLSSLWRFLTRYDYYVQ